MELTHHPETVFIRFNIEKRSQKWFRRYEQRPVNNQVRKDCLKLARKYLSERAQAFHASLACEEDFVDDVG